MRGVVRPLRGGGGKAVLTLLAAAVPVGAIVAISNNDDSPTPARMNMANPMPGTGDTTSPTVRTIMGTVGTGNDANTITWTVTFSEPVRNLAESQFTVSGGGMVVTVPSQTDANNRITFTTTHTDMNDGDIVLTFTPGTMAEDNAGNEFAMNTMRMSSAVTITVAPAGPMPLPMVVGLLESIPTAAQDTIISTATGERSILRRAGTGDDAGKFVVELGAPTSRTSYTFASGANSGGAMEYVRATSEDSTLIYRPVQIIDSNDMVVDTVAGLHAFYTGTMLDADSGTTVSAIDILSTGTVITDGRDVPGGAGDVNYSGSYIVVAGNPANGAAFDSTTQTGTVTMTINFQGFNNNISGETFDSTNTKSGEIAGLGISQAGLLTTTFTGEGTLAGYSHTMNGANSQGGFYGTNGAEFIDITAATTTTSATPASTAYIMGIHVIRDSN